MRHTLSHHFLCLVLMEEERVRRHTLSHHFCVSSPNGRGETVMRHTEPSFFVSSPNRRWETVRRQTLSLHSDWAHRWNSDSRTVTICAASSRLSQASIFMLLAAMMALASSTLVPVKIKRRITESWSARSIRATSLCNRISNLPAFPQQQQREPQKEVFYCEIIK